MRGEPFSSAVISVITKQTGRFTLEITAISLTVPSFIPAAPSSRGIIPLIPPKSTIKLCFASQTTATASNIFSSRMASPSVWRFLRLFRFSSVFIRFPSGKYAVILTPPFCYLFSIYYEKFFPNITNVTLF